MAAGVQRTQHAGTRGQLCGKGKAAQAGSGGQVQAGHGVGHEGSGNYAARPGLVQMTPLLVRYFMALCMAWHRRSTACAICGTSGAANDMRSVCRLGSAG